MIRRPPRSPRFPYTTRLRSHLPGRAVEDGDPHPPLEPLPGLDEHRVPRQLAEQQVEGQVGLHPRGGLALVGEDRKSTRLNSSHANISYAVFWLLKKTQRGIL